MTVDIKDLKKAKNKLEVDVKEILYRFEDTTGFMVNGIEVKRRFIENANFKRSILYDTKINITL